MVQRLTVGCAQTPTTPFVKCKPQGVESPGHCSAPVKIEDAERLVAVAKHRVMDAMERCYFLTNCADSDDLPPYARGAFVVHAI
eukprot:5006890-Pyramimonas_sp.AAC.1